VEGQEEQALHPGDELNIFDLVPILDEFFSEVSLLDPVRDNITENTKLQVILAQLYQRQGCITQTVPQIGNVSKPSEIKTQAINGY
jgi:hypothetical protein